jgi:hypothetical protein
MRLLETESQLRWARQESFALAERPLAELLHAAPVTPLAQTIAAAGEQRAAAVGGAR